VTNKNYERGYRPELRLMRAIEDLHPQAWSERSHASKGTFDVVACLPWGLYLIQVKRTASPFKSLKAAETRFKEDLDQIRAVPFCPFVHRWIALYEARTIGKATGTWRIFEICGTENILLEHAVSGRIGPVLEEAMHCAIRRDTQGAGGMST